MRRVLEKYAVILVLLVVFVLLLIVFRKQWMPSIGNVFKAQPVVIDDTPILIREINELAQLCTISAYSEVVADSVSVVKKTVAESLLPDLSGFSGLPVTGKRIVVIGKGRVIAGTDLKKIRAEDIFVAGDSVALRLPPAEILDAIMNPADFEVFSELGEWSPSAVTAVKVKARNKMISQALQQQILEKANNRSQLLLENFLLSIGYKKVKVEIRAAVRSLQTS